MHVMGQASAVVRPLSLPIATAKTSATSQKKIKRLIPLAKANWITGDEWGEKSREKKKRRK